MAKRKTTTRHGAAGEPDRPIVISEPDGCEPVPSLVYYRGALGRLEMIVTREPHRIAQAGVRILAIMPEPQVRRLGKAVWPRFALPAARRAG